jgi:opacity protein-like surface antigen
MKKLFLVLALAFAGIFTANAQVWVGGGLGASIQKNHTSLSIAPEVGYAINDQWQVALGAGYGFNQTKVDVLGETITTNTNTLALQPYVRYVATTIGKFSLFFDLCGDFGLLDDARDYAVTLQPGIAWMATDHWTAAFRFGKVGYDHNFYGTDGFLMNCDLAAPQIRLYYNF